MPKDRRLELILAKAAGSPGLPNDNPTAVKARQRRKAGLATAGGGYLLASRAGDVSTHAADLLTPSKKRLGVKGKVRNEIVRSRGKRLAGAAGKAGAALVGAGLLVAGEGALHDLHSRQAFHRAKTQAKDHAQAVISTAVQKGFDPERQRRGRNDVYAGAAAGGAVVAGSRAVRANRGAHAARGLAAVEHQGVVDSTTESASRMSRMKLAPGQEGNLPRTSSTISGLQSLGAKAEKHRDAAETLGTKARKLTRISRGSAVGAAALGAAALGLHNHDRRGGGRTYSY